MVYANMNKLPFLLLLPLVVSLATCTPTSGTSISAKTLTSQDVLPTATPPVLKDIGSMLPIPAGTFQMGCDPENNAGVSCYSQNGSGPVLHPVYLDPYQIDKYEVTNGSYAQCVAAGVCSVPYSFSSPTRPSYYGNPEFADYPVMNIVWGQAGDYCKWAGKRLPTEAEWEKAARGSAGTPIYPWGDESPTCALADFGGSQGCVGDTSAVGSHPSGASPYGAQDMVGNVSEWVADWWDSDYFLFSSANNPLGPVTGDYKVYRGGDWNGSNLGVATRIDPDPNLLLYTLNPEPDSFIGFRCAASALDASSASSMPETVATATTEPAFSSAPPQSGKANVVGRVLWNQEPVADTEVRLCQGTYSSFGSIDCMGTEVSTTTDDAGIYTFANEPPGQYVIIVHGIDTDNWFIFQRIDPNGAYQSFLNSAEPTKFDLVAGQTLAINDMSIYKFDLELASPANMELFRENPTLTWNAYPGAAYYGLSIGYVSAAEKVLTNSLELKGLLPDCDYHWKVDAYNALGEKISVARIGTTFIMLGQVSSCTQRLNSPEDGAKLVEGGSIEFSWQSNPLATEYEFYLSDADTPFTRVSGTTYKLEQGLPPGSYTWTITAYQNGRQLASSDYSNFEVIIGGSTNAPENPPAGTPSQVPIPEFPMALIPAGSFQMGGLKCMLSSGGTCLSSEPGDDNPPHTVTLVAFKIDIYEVTYAQYAACEAAGMCRPLDSSHTSLSGDYGKSSYANHPITDVTWYDAVAYCTWRGGRLPSEAEWEKAARGGLQGMIYPWGDEKPVCTPGAENGAHTDNCQPSSTAAVGTYGSNAFGLFDMTGNVAEWMNDWYQSDYYAASPGSNPPGPESGETRVIRGGSFENVPSLQENNLSVFYRSGYTSPSTSLWDLGFRCVQDVGK